MTKKEEIEFYLMLTWIREDNRHQYSFFADSKDENETSELQIIKNDLEKAWFLRFFIELKDDKIYMVIIPFGGYEMTILNVNSFKLTDITGRDFIYNRMIV